MYNILYPDIAILVKFDRLILPLYVTCFALFSMFGFSIFAMLLVPLSLSYAGIYIG